MALFVSLIFHLIHTVISQSFDIAYNQELAINALFYSYGAYCDASELASWSCQWCDLVTSFNIESVISGNHLQAFVGYDPTNSSIILSFRGTDNNANRISDLGTIIYHFHSHTSQHEYSQRKVTRHTSIHQITKTTLCTLESMKHTKALNAIIYLKNSLLSSTNTQIPP